MADFLIDNINQYEHWDELVISRNIIPHGTPTENYIEFVLNLFWQHLNMNLDKDLLSVSHFIGEKTIR